MRGWFAGFFLMALAACETGPAMTPAECQVADWAAVGFRDGAEGRQAARFVALEQACAAAGLPADRARYMAGRADGLTDLCQPDRAFRLGLSGGAYHGVCPPAFDAVFRSAFADGALAHEALSAARSAESAVESLRSERDEIRRKLTANEIGFSASATQAERDRHAAEIDRLRSDLDRVEDRLYDAERDRSWRSRDLQRVRRDLGFRYGDW